MSTGKCNIGWTASMISDLKVQRDGHIGAYISLCSPSLSISQQSAHPNSPGLRFVIVGHKKGGFPC